jgi:hypothetical protein
MCVHIYMRLCLQSKILFEYQLVGAVPEIILALCTETHIMVQKLGDFAPYLLSLFPI